MKLLASSLLLTVSVGCSAGPDPCDASGTACVWAGVGERGFNIANPKAHRLDSKLYFPEDVTFGPDDRAYIVDWNNHRIRRVEKDGSLVVVVGTDYEGDGPPEMEDRLPICNPTGALATTVAMNHMTDAKFGPDGKLYIAAWHNNKIRVFDPETNMVTAIGNGYGYAGDGQLACNALFNQPKTLAFAPDGTMYTIDQRNVRIRRIQPGPTGLIDTIAGTGVVGDEGDGGPAATATFGFEIGTTPRPSGGLVLVGNTLFVADSLNNRIRRIDLETGMVDCIAGLSGEAGYSGDGGPALQATFNFPSDIELGPDGRLYVADRYNYAVRAIDLVTGTIETVAGSGVSCDTAKGSCPNVVPPLELQLNELYGIAFDREGSLYISDTHNNQVIKVQR